MITKTDIEYGKIFSFNEGKAEGKAEGAAAKQIEIAKAMLEKKSSVEFIASVTGLTEEQVKNLR